MASSGSQPRLPYEVAPPPDADQVPSLSQMPSQVPSQMWTDGILSWCHNGQIVTTSTSGQARSWESHFDQGQGQENQLQDENLSCDQSQSYPVNIPSPGLGTTDSQGFLRPVSLIPEQYRSLFSQFPYFNIVQSTVFDDVFYTDRSLVVSAPTGSGKTVVMELALVRLMMAKATDDDTQDVPVPPRIVYLAPMKALVAERYIDWRTRLGELGIICAEITGDTDHDDIAVIGKSQVILTTPEKWDSLTRRWRNHVALMEAVSLLLIDEVHVLGDRTRGPTMEAVVSRMKTIRTTRPSTSPHKPPLRFVAVSATIPNADDLAVWLSDGQSPAVTHKLEESLRPVKLRRVVLGYDCPESWSEFRFDLSLTYALATVVATHSENKPTLVFVSTRKGAQMAATTLSKEARLVRNSSHKQLLTSVGNVLRDNKLRECILAGVAFHHAGLDMADRRQVEDLFTSGHLPVLVSTSTLAMGVNLPAHLVIVKSTSQYNGNVGGHEEYSSGQILQMIGRAGRPQFDTHATAVIMTKKQLKVKYENLVNGKDVLESHLHQHLIEHLNAEIVLGTVTDLGVAVEWLRTTFLYVRVQRNPRHYGLQAGLEPHQLEAKLQEMCTREVNALSRAGMISQNEVELQPLTPGRLMARYCVSFVTMETFTQLRGDESLKELVEIISNTREFWDVKLRTSEKRVLNSINKTQGIGLRFPIKGRIKMREQKINCLIQAVLGSQAIPEPSLTQDANKIFRTGQRSTKCLAEYGATRSEYELQLNTTLLAKCFRCRLWENSRHVTRQLESIGPSFSATFVHAKITSFTALEALSPRDVELILNRQPPFGNKIRDQAVKLPRYELTLQQTNEVAPRTSEVRVTVDLVNKDDLVSGATTPRHHSCRLLIGDFDNCVVFHQRITDAALLVSGPITRSVSVSRTHAGDELAVNLISESWAGLDVQSCYTPRYVGPPPTPPPLPAPSGSTPATEDTQIPHGPQSKGGQAAKGGRRACLHACGDKTTCAHSCCKVGVSGRSGSTSSNSNNSSNRNNSSSNSSSRQSQSLPGLVQEMRKRAGQLPFTPDKKIKLAEGGGRPDGGDSSLSRFRYMSNRPRLLPFPVPKGRSASATVLPSNTSACQPSNQERRNYSLAKNQPNLHHFFAKNQAGDGGGSKGESAPFDTRDHNTEGSFGGFSSVEEKEAFEDLVNTFGCENKENLPDEFDDNNDFLFADLTVGEAQGDDEYDEAFNEPLEIEDDSCDQNLFHTQRRNSSQSLQQQNGGGSKEGRNYFNPPAGNGQEQTWNSGMNTLYKGASVHGNQFQRSGSQGSAFQSPPVGQASRFARPPQGSHFQRPQGPQGNRFETLLIEQRNQFQRSPGTQGNRFLRPPSTQGNQFQRPPGTQQNQFQRPPTGNQFQRSPGTQQNQFQRPPTGNQFQRPPGTQQNQFQRPPMRNQFQGPPGTQQNQIQRPPTGNQFHRPPGPQQNQFQRPPTGNQFHRPPGPQQNQFQQPPPGNQFQRPSSAQQNQFQRPPSGNQFQRLPSTQRNQFQRPPTGNQFQRPPGTQQNQCQRLPTGNNQFQRPPTGNQFQRPPGTQQNQFQRPPTGNQFQGPPGTQQNQFQQTPNTQNNQIQRPQTTQVSQFQKLSSRQGYQPQAPPDTQGTRLQRPPCSQFQRIPGNQFQRPSGSQIQQPPLAQASQLQNQFQRLPTSQGNQFLNPPNAQGNRFHQPPYTQGNQLQAYQGDQDCHYQRPFGSQGSILHGPSSTQSSQFQILPVVHGGNQNQVQQPSLGQGSWVQRLPCGQSNQNQKMSGVQDVGFQISTGMQAVTESQYQGVHGSQSCSFQREDGEQVSNKIPIEQIGHLQRQSDYVQMLSSENQFHAEYADSVHCKSPFSISLANSMKPEVYRGEQNAFRGNASSVGAGNALQDPDYCLEYATGCNSFRGEFYASDGAIANEPSTMPFERPETFPLGASLAPEHVARSQTRPVKNPASHEWRSSILCATVPPGHGQQARPMGEGLSRGDAARQKKPVAGVKPFLSMTTTKAPTREGNTDVFSHLTKEWTAQRYRGGGAGGGGREGKTDGNRGKHSLLTGSTETPPSAPQKSHEDWRDLEVFQWCRQQERLSLDSLYKGRDTQDATKDAPPQTSEYKHAPSTSFPTSIPLSQAPAVPPGSQESLGYPGEASNTSLNVTTTQDAVEGHVGVMLTNVGGIQQNININLSNFVESGISSQTSNTAGSNAQKQVRNDPLVRGILKNTPQSTWSGPLDIFQGIL